MSLRLAITSGEPAGIGPDLCIKLAQNPQDHELVVLADKQLLTDRAKKLGLPLQIKEYDGNKPAAPTKAGQLCVLPVNCQQKSTAGQLNPANSQYVINMLKQACDGCLNKEFDAMITAPVHKGIINEASFSFSGHTEFLRDYCQVDEVVMMLASDQLKVALVTTHLPLKDVSAEITKAKLERVIRILQHDLKHFFAIKQPSILVAGLNPHAGEGGHLGSEEIDTIEPVIKNLNQQGFNLIGPLPADTLFTPKYLDTAHAALAMYHDQGLPVLKYQGFGQAANITLGLPIVRTSVDHGTALELAGTNQISTTSLEFAIKAAIEMNATKLNNQGALS